MKYQLNRRWVPPWLIPLLLGGLLVVSPWLGVNAAWLRQLTLIAIFTMVVAGLNLTFGYAGLLSLGQVAFFATGAYVTGILAIHGWDMIPALLVATAGAGLLGLITTIPGLRLGGWGLPMASFFLIVIIPDVVQIIPQTGGLEGLNAVPPPHSFGGMLTQNETYVVITGAMVLTLAALRNLVTSSHGNSLRVLRQSPVLAESLGLNVHSLKIKAFTIGALPAGMAGGFLVYINSFISPSYFDLELLIAILAASVLGGTESIYGAFLGSAALQLGLLRSNSFAQYQLVAYGAFLVLAGVFFSGGIAGLVGTVLRRGMSAVGGGGSAAFVALEAQDWGGFGSIPGQRLEATNVSKNFMGNLAVDSVSLLVEPGKVTGLVGPNGSGKTTLLNLISGVYAPSSGDVVLGQRRLHGMASHRVARLGISRTFQTPIIPDGLTSLEVVASARYTLDAPNMLATVLRLPGYRRRVKARSETALQMMQLVGIARLADKPAAELPLGSRRLVEVARALASRPAAVLLDEPASGLDEGEVQELATVIRRVAAAGATVLLVEHNFHMVCEVSDRIYVLDSGRMLASGTPEEIQRDEAVGRSYLGQLPDSEATLVTKVSQVSE